MPEIRGDDLVLAHITAGSKREALRIGRLLVEERLAARLA
ncbi:divalent-cation tolerance protein CutA [Azospirillum sp. B510]|nr:divalent-cation tolerance protein CutA [Azospirillum sp. B510]